MGDSARLVHWVISGTVPNSQRWNDIPFRMHAFKRLAPLRLRADGHYLAYFQKRPFPSAIQDSASSMRLSRVAAVFASLIQSLYSF